MLLRGDDQASIRIAGTEHHTFLGEGQRADADQVCARRSSVIPSHLAGTMDSGCWPCSPRDHSNARLHLSGEPGPDDEERPSDRGQQPDQDHAQHCPYVCHRSFDHDATQRVAHPPAIALSVSPVATGDEEPVREHHHVRRPSWRWRRRCSPRSRGRTPSPRTTGSRCAGPVAVPREFALADDHDVGVGTGDVKASVGGVESVQDACERN